MKKLLFITLSLFSFTFTYSHGLKIDYKEIISTGIAIRNENSILGQFKIMFTKNFQITYAHDFSFSNILLRPLNSSEFMVSYISSIRENNKHKNTISFF